MISKQIICHLSLITLCCLQCLGKSFKYMLPKFPHYFPWNPSSFCEDLQGLAIVHCFYCQSCWLHCVTISRSHFVQPLEFRTVCVSTFVHPYVTMDACWLWCTQKFSVWQSTTTLPRNKQANLPRTKKQPVNKVQELLRNP